MPCPATTFGGCSGCELFLNRWRTPANLVGLLNRDLPCTVSEAIGGERSRVFQGVCAIEDLPVVQVSNWEADIAVAVAQPRDQRDGCDQR